jgi:transcriptional regulator with XRE-family HTH domain
MPRPPRHPTLAELGRRIRRVRARADLTQQDVATLAGLSRTSVANIEGGRQDPGVVGLVAIAAALEVPPASLLPDEPDSMSAGHMGRLVARNAALRDALGRLARLANEAARNG